MVAETMSDLRTAKEETEGQSITLGPQTAPVPFFPLKRSGAWNVSAHMMNGDGRFSEMANHLNPKSKNSPLVTVFVGCYNHSRFVGECLDSVRHQTYPNL